ncbi:hypothetical protein, partial [Streptomyces sp. NPDC001435]|uniref:hypothetical protein n=1 Tax=Streptomyces sp. NPDC001435 TaxID=3364576 RepID=UPI0036A4F508
ERYSPVEVRPGQTPAHSHPLIPYTTTRDTILTGSLLVVVAAVAGRSSKSRERLGLQRVGEPVDADAAGLDGVALAGGRVIGLVPA